MALTDQTNTPSAPAGRALAAAAAAAAAASTVAPSSTFALPRGLVGSTAAAAATGRDRPGLGLPKDDRLYGGNDGDGAQKPTAAPKRDASGGGGRAGLGLPKDDRIYDDDDGGSIGKAITAVEKGKEDDAKGKLRPRRKTKPVFSIYDEAAAAAAAAQATTAGFEEEEEEGDRDRRDRRRRFDFCMTRDDDSDYSDDDGDGVVSDDDEERSGTAGPVRRTSKRRTRNGKCILVEMNESVLFSCDCFACTSSSLTQTFTVVSTHALITSYFTAHRESNSGRRSHPQGRDV